MNENKQNFQFFKTLFGKKTRRESIKFIERTHTYWQICKSKLIVWKTIWHRLLDRVESNFFFHFHAAHNTYLSSNEDFCVAKLFSLFWKMNEAKKNEHECHIRIWLFIICGKSHRCHEPVVVIQLTLNVCIPFFMLFFFSFVLRKKQLLSIL